MRVTISHEVGEPVQLPINYHHIQQSIIYRGLEEEGSETRLHDIGAAYGKRNYKLFTFGPITGKYEVADKRITFSQTMSFTVSSVDPERIRRLGENFKNRGITYGERHIEEVEVSFSDETVESETALIRMLSPICVYATGRENGKTIFYSPEDPEFPELVSNNFSRKYAACYGVMPEGGIELRPLRVTSKDKYVTSYKQTYLQGWLGEYLLCGKRKYLDFLYQTGLGSKNSQGFGMFELKKSKEEKDRI